MPQTILTDGEEEPRVERPVRKSKPTAALLSGEPVLPFQQKAVNAFCVAKAARRAAERQQAIDALAKNRGPTTTSNSSRDASESSSPEPPSVPGSPIASTSTTTKKKRPYIEDVDDEDDERENARTNPKREFYRHRYENNKLIPT